MNAANRPIDLLLNTGNAKVNQSQRLDSGHSTSRDSDLSLSKLREKSFDDVYRQQRREDTEARRTSQAEQRNDRQERAENRASEQRKQAGLATQSVADKRSQKNAQGVENGKALPHEPASTTEKTASRIVDKGDKTESLAVDLNEEVDVTVSFDDQILNEAELGTQELNQGELELSEVSLSEDDDSADGEQIAVNIDDVEVVNATLNQATAAFAQQPTQEEQSKLVAPDLAKNNVNNGVNAAPASKASATGAEHSGQSQPQDRFIPPGQELEFKALREQFSVANFKGASDKGVAADATTTADSAADRLPRLNALTQTTQGLGQPRPGVVTASVQTPVSSADWGQAMSQRIMWLVNRGINGAELQLNPRELGPVDVRISVNGEQASVQFTSQHAAVREALESSMVRLREMMESSGLDLADVNVSDQSHSEQAQSDAKGASDPAATGENDELDEGLETQTVQRIESDGLVDFYA